MRSPQITHDAPATNLFSYWFGRFLMLFFRFEVKGNPPAGGKFVLIGAPHTSNWDFPIGLAALYIFRIKLSWLGKDALFKKPFGGFMRWLGGIAVDRSSPHGVVEQIAEKFRQSDKLIVLITPSATRKKRDHWKSGFYHIALAAQVPIVCGSLDYKRKEAGLGLSFVPSGDVKADMDRVREFYKGVQGKHPEQTTTVRLLDEVGREL